MRLCPPALDREDITIVLHNVRLSKIHVLKICIETKQVPPNHVLSWCVEQVVYAYECRQSYEIRILQTKELTPAFFYQINSYFCNSSWSAD